jgi:hypothetical protein
MQHALAARARRDDPVLQEAIRTIADKDALYDIHHGVSDVSSFDYADCLHLFHIEDEKTLEDAILALTKKQISDVLWQMPTLLEIFSENKFVPIIRTRYRKYMFRILYLLWQDYYDKPKFRNLFLYVVNNPKTAEYVTEVNFSAETLRAIALSNQAESKFVELARVENLDMREFLAFHKINRDSVIAIDVMSVFFLFCSAPDYMEFGSERLIIALMRFETKNQVKMLNNMVRKLDKEGRMALKDVFLYFIYKYSFPSAERIHEVWGMVQPETLEIIQDEFRTAR